METVLLVIHLLVAIFLVCFILMQRSGGGALDGLGGGNGASNFLNACGTGIFNPHNCNFGDNIFHHQYFVVALLQEHRASVKFTFG